MSSNNIVSIRVEALGVSITIADGSIAIEQTKTELPATATMSEVENPATASGQALSAGSPASPTGETVPTPARPLPPVEKRASPTPKDDRAGTALPDSEEIPVMAKRPTVQGNSDAPPSPQASNGDDIEALMAPPHRKPRSSQTKPLWSGEEVEKLTALFPTHSARAIATQLGRSFTAIRSKAQNLGLKKPPPPPVRSAREAKPAPKPKSLSAAATADSPPTFDQNDAAGHGFCGVSLLDHHRGQCRWIVSDVWPVMYCGAPVVDSSSWCELHSTRVFNPRSQALGA